MGEKARNKKAVKPLKTNSLAKSMISRPNDFNNLRPPARNRSFRFAKQFVSLSLFFAFVDASACRRRGRSGNARPKIGRRLPTRAARTAALQKSGARKKVAQGRW